MTLGMNGGSRVSTRQQVRLSVRVITYNHARFIAQALDSALNQEVTFAYEIVVGDDCSTDGTREIVLDYQRRYPDRIRAILSDVNLGCRRNFVRTLDGCRGEYIALLDGDDYWTSPHKLQTQVSFLDTHPDYVISFHDVHVVYEDHRAEPHRYCEPDQPRTSDLVDLLKGNFIPACSVVFRRSRRELPAWFHSAPIGDWPLHIFLAEGGRIGYLGEVMATYRRHAGGLTSRLDPEDFLRAMTRTLGRINAHLGSRYEAAIRVAVSNLWLNAFAEPDRSERRWRHASSAEIDEMLEPWLPEFPLSRRQRNRLLGAAFARLGTSRARAGGPLGARAWLFRAAWHDPAWLGRWGFWSVNLEAVFGKVFAEWVRRRARSVAGTRHLP